MSPRHGLTPLSESAGAVRIVWSLGRAAPGLSFQLLQEAMEPVKLGFSPFLCMGGLAVEYPEY